MIDAALLGTGGMMPLPDRFLTSLLLRYNGGLILIDCGECTQVTLKSLGWGIKNINTILITHYHGDHVAGLPGILLAIGNSGRKEELEIAGPEGLAEVYGGLRVIFPELPFPVKLRELKELSTEKTVSFKSGDLKINALKLDHRIICCGYSIELERKGKFDTEKAAANNVPMKIWGKLQKYDTFEYDGKIYTSDMVLGKPRKGLKLTYCTDTRPTAEMCDFAKHSDLFICEGMYGENEKLEKATEKKHMIFSEAAEIAKKAEVEELWLTHFSPALKDPKSFLENAVRIFPNTLIGETRKTKTLLFKE